MKRNNVETIGQPPQSPASGPVGAAIPALVSLLDRLDQHHRVLHGILSEKVDWMRASDMDRMRETMQREAECVGAIREQEGLRRQLVTQIGQGLGMSASSARVVNVRELAARLAEPDRSALLGAADRLRSSVARVAERNRVAGLIAREILRHFRHVFSAMSASGEDRKCGYTHRGECSLGASPHKVFDAVG